MENKIDYVVITTKEYKELIKNEIDLDRAWEDYGELEEKHLDLKIEFDAMEKELKELLLTITYNKTSFHYKEAQNYEVIGSSELADYITKNYLINGQLQFRKVKETKED